VADDDMERLDRAMEVLRRRAKVWEDAELGRMETTLSQTTPPAFYGDVPPPGFCHPYHEKHKRFIIDWLDGKSSINAYDLRLPVIPPIRFTLVDPKDLLAFDDPKTITVRRERAFATAPYVGRPFVYWWWAGVDDHGRGVGGEKTTLAYTDPGWGYDDRG
jgi:hypothetical protein